MENQTTDNALMKQQDYNIQGICLALIEEKITRPCNSAKDLRRDVSPRTSKFIHSLSFAGMKGTSNDDHSTMHHHGAGVENKNTDKRVT